MAPAEPVQDVESVLLSVVAEKTGYPREMLEAGMDLEADLGVDSIKRVEILGTLQDKMPALPTIRGEELGELRTLAQITDYLKNQLPSTGSGVPPRATDAQSTTDFSLSQRGAGGDFNLELDEHRRVRSIFAVAKGNFVGAETGDTAGTVGGALHSLIY